MTPGLIINPKHIITLPSSLRQHTSHSPNTKNQHDAAKQNLEKARQEEETARLAHEKNQKQKKVTELRATVGSLDKQVAEAHAAKVTAKAAMDAIPNDQDKTAHIDSHSKADLHHKTLKDEHAAKKPSLLKLSKEEDVVEGVEHVKHVEKRENQNTIVAVRNIQRNADAHAERDVLVVDKLLNSNNYYTCLE